MHTNTNCTKVFTQRKKCTLLAEGIALSEDEDEFDQAAAAANAAAAAADGDGDGDGGDGDGDGAEWEACDTPSLPLQVFFWFTRGH